MPLPSGLQTVTVTAGPYTAADGTAAVGSVIFTPAAPIHHTPTGAVILAGQIAVRLDSSGSATVVLPASDAAGITPTGVTYGVQFAFAYGTPTPPPFDVLLPAASPTVDLDGLTPVTSSAGVGVSVPMLTIPQIVADPAVLAAFVPFWAPSTAVDAGAVRMTALGLTITRNSSGTTRATYDATEAALWTVTSGGGGGGGSTTDASLLTSGILPAARIADGSIADAKLAAGTALTAAERTKLAGIATGATANSTDAALLARANHTGTQAASTITGLATVATTGAYTDLTGKPVVGLTPTAKTTTYTAVDGDLVVADATSAGFTVTLPTPTAGRRIGVRKIDSTANLVTITASSGTIDGAASWTFAARWQTQVYVADGTNWQRLDVPGVQAIAATGTPSSSTYLRGDGAWATPAGGGGSQALGFPSTFPIAGLQVSAQVLNNRICAARVYGSGTITKIRVQIGTASGNICVGVYAGGTSGIANAQPGTRKGTSGSITCPTAGTADIALLASTDVSEGDWFVIMADNNVATFQAAGTGSGGFSALAGLGGWTATGGTTLPLPSSLTITNWESKTYLMSGVT